MPETGDRPRPIAAAMPPFPNAVFAVSAPSFPITLA